MLNRKVYRSGQWIEEDERKRQGAGDKPRREIVYGATMVNAMGQYGERLTISSEALARVEVEIDALFGLDQLYYKKQREREVPQRKLSVKKLPDIITFKKRKIELE